MIRTSASDPLRIDVVPCQPFGSGLIGITFCPGKCAPSVHGAGGWQRDLQADIDVIRGWGARAVVTLVEDHELTAMQVSGLGAAVGAAGMQWIHLPITDVSTPDARFTSAWPAARSTLLPLLHKGERVLVHCRGGLGRAGMVASFLLIELGMEPSVALRTVRRGRRGAVETMEQERFVLRFKPGATVSGRTG